VKQLTAQFMLKTAGQKAMAIWTKSGTFNYWTWKRHSCTGTVLWHLMYSFLTITAEEKTHYSD